MWNMWLTKPRFAKDCLLHYTNGDKKQQRKVKLRDHWSKVIHPLTRRSNVKDSCYQDHTFNDMKKK